jgi:Rieske Fe-S protein
VREKGDFSRRGLLKVWIFACVAAIGGSLAAILGRFFVGGTVSTPGERPRLAAGPLAQFAGAVEPVDVVISFREEQGYYSDQRRQRIYLYSENDRLCALSSICSHLGCSVSWDPSRKLFTCPCHGGTYRKDGTVAGGPPPRPLERLPIEIENGTVFVRLNEA